MDTNYHIYHSSSLKSFDYFKKMEKMSNYELYDINELINLKVNIPSRIDVIPYAHSLRIIQGHEEAPIIGIKNIVMNIFKFDKFPEEEVYGDILDEEKENTEKIDKTILNDVDISLLRNPSNDY